MPVPCSVSGLFQDFEHDGKLNITVIGVVGGPGSGKGTQCARLASRSPHLAHLSIGDTLRHEMATEGSPYAELIRGNMAAGNIGPPELTIGLLRRRMEAEMRRGVHTFVLDGFPRNIAQSECLESMIAPIQAVIVLDCGDDILVSRLSTARRDRFDDKEENIIWKRITTFRKTTAQVIAMFESRKVAFRIDAEQAVEEVAAHVDEVLQRIYGGRNPATS